tara:strand:+ start:795 stop:1058 length:264 start_codon:yes stop_codon:yes gene_type:complete
MKIKLKELGILPKEKKITLNGCQWDGAKRYVFSEKGKGYNQALKEVGEVEIELDVEKIKEIAKYANDNTLEFIYLNNSIKDIIRRVE